LKKIFIILLLSSFFVLTNCGTEIKNVPEALPAEPDDQQLRQEALENIRQNNPEKRHKLQPGHSFI